MGQSIPLPSGSGAGPSGPQLPSSRTRPPASVRYSSRFLNRKKQRAVSLQRKPSRRPEPAPRKQYLKSALLSPGDAALKRGLKLPFESSLPLKGAIESLTSSDKLTRLNLEDEATEDEAPWVEATWVDLTEVKEQTERIELHLERLQSQFDSQFDYIGPPPLSDQSRPLKRIEERLEAIEVGFLTDLMEQEESVKRIERRVEATQSNLEATDVAVFTNLLKQEESLKRIERALAPNSDLTASAVASPAEPPSVLKKPPRANTNETGIPHPSNLEVFST